MGLLEAAMIADEISVAAHKAADALGHEEFGRFCSLSGQSTGAALVAKELRARHALALSKGNYND